MRTFIIGTLVALVFGCGWLGGAIHQRWDDEAIVSAALSEPSERFDVPVDVSEIPPGCARHFDYVVCTSDPCADPGTRGCI